jgi:hypothetical protein
VNLKEGRAKVENLEFLHPDFCCCPFLRRHKRSEMRFRVKLVGLLRKQFTRQHEGQPRALECLALNRRCSAVDIVLWTVYSALKLLPV